MEFVVQFEHLVVFEAQAGHVLVRAVAPVKHDIMPSLPGWIWYWGTSSSSRFSIDFAQNPDLVIEVIVEISTISRFHTLVLVTRGCGESRKF